MWRERSDGFRGRKAQVGGICAHVLPQSALVPASFGRLAPPQAEHGCWVKAAVYPGAPHLENAEIKFEEHFVVTK